jgi:hypothetical protein
MKDEFWYSGSSGRGLGSRGGEWTSFRDEGLKCTRRVECYRTNDKT